MPIVTIAKATGVTAALGNRNLATLLGNQAPMTGWVRNLVLQSPETNSSAVGGIKVGSGVMTSTDYDTFILPGDTDDDGDGPTMLNSRYVRTDESTDQTLIIRFEMT